MISLIASLLVYMRGNDKVPDGARVVDATEVGDFRATVIVVEVLPVAGFMSGGPLEIRFWVIGFTKLAEDGFEVPVVLTRAIRRTDTILAAEWVNLLRQLFDGFHCDYIVALSDEVGIALKLAGVKHILSAHAFMVELRVP